MNKKEIRILLFTFFVAVIGSAFFAVFLRWMAGKPFSLQFLGLGILIMIPIASIGLLLGIVLRKKLPKDKFPFVFLVNFFIIATIYGSKFVKIFIKKGIFDWISLIITLFCVFFFFKQLVTMRKKNK